MKRKSLDGIKAGGEDNITSNRHRRLLHLVAQLLIADDDGGIAHVMYDLVESLHTAHDDTFLAVGILHDR